MPISSSQGRIVKEIIEDPDFGKIHKDAKKKFCDIVTKKVNTAGKILKNDITKRRWQDVFVSFTRMRRLIEIKTEACK